nr:hypothetical protein [Tanacetum cinerariifolium]GEX29353.1 hypothetical protein [Tanacetum cinerariifolium]
MKFVNTEETVTVSCGCGGVDEGEEEGHVLCERDEIRIMVIAIVIGAFSTSFYFMIIVVILIVKGYDESERLRKRQDYPQPDMAMYCVCSHGGCVLCLWLFAHVRLLYNHVVVPYLCDKKEKKNAANEGWTVVTHIKGRKEKTEDAERGRLLVQLRTWINSQKRKIKKLGSISIVLRKGRHNETTRMFDGPGSYNGRKNGYQETLQSRNTVIAAELMGIC